jgi:hypothetical protein
MSRTNDHTVGGWAAVPPGTGVEVCLLQVLVHADSDTAAPSKTTVNGIRGKAPRSIHPQIWRMDSTCVKRRSRFVTALARLETKGAVWIFRLR